MRCHFCKQKAAVLTAVGWDKNRHQIWQCSACQQADGPATPRQQFQAAARLREQGLHVQIHQAEGQSE